ncbi:hypothetical protein BJ138DRAFT_1213127 [Hygrophoropsis aurantiaca]|uniref:Uncharacterized protein n=1 Tax=Hygrophoropsis aurantiaca TaxID=72124 RepID=A0ACB8A3F4_9AGAM|nr:hypothetical protein BJ138DRAFT_1213127 [Hygrophoropsis aurantiaca]
MRSQLPATQLYLSTGSSNVALDVLTGVASEFLLNVGRTLRFLCGKRSNGMAPKWYNEDPGLNRHIQDDAIRHGACLGDLRRKLEGAYREVTAIEVLSNDALLAAEDDEEDESAFLMGNFSDAFGDDFEPSQTWHRGRVWHVESHYTEEASQGQGYSQTRSVFTTPPFKVPMNYGEGVSNSLHGFCNVRRTIELPLDELLGNIDPTVTHPWVRQSQNPFGFSPHLTRIPPPSQTAKEALYIVTSPSKIGPSSGTRANTHTGPPTLAVKTQGAVPNSLVSRSTQSTGNFLLLVSAEIQEKVSYQQHLSIHGSKNHRDAYTSNQLGQHIGERRRARDRANNFLGVRRGGRDCAMVITEGLNTTPRKQLVKVCPDPASVMGIAPPRPPSVKSSVAAATAASRAKANSIATAPPTLRHQATSSSMLHERLERLLRLRNVLPRCPCSIVGLRFGKRCRRRPQLRLATGIPIPEDSDSDIDESSEVAIPPALHGDGPSCITSMTCEVTRVTGANTDFISAPAEPSIFPVMRGDLLSEYSSAPSHAFLYTSSTIDPRAFSSIEYSTSTSGGQNLRNEGAPSVAAA